MLSGGLAVTKHTEKEKHIIRKYQLLEDIRCLGDTCTRIKKVFHTAYDLETYDFCYKSCCDYDNDGYTYTFTIPSKLRKRWLKELYNHYFEQKHKLMKEFNCD
jgi:hypothetical protein